MNDFTRHKFIYRLLWRPVTSFASWLFHFTAEPVPELPGPFLVIANHNTDYDMLLVARAFGKRHMYFVASEHIFRWGLLSKLIAWSFGPIARSKGSADGASALGILRTLKSGKNVCLFAEGNKSFNGQTTEIHPTVGRLVKMAPVTLVTYRLEGLYFASPRWSAHLRRGRTSGKVANIYPPEVLQSMTAEEVYRAVVSDTYEDAYQEQEKRQVVYRGKAPAEKLETALYLCPSCRQIATLHSHDDTLECDCGFRVRFNEYGYFESSGESEGWLLPFQTITQWDQWQSEQMERIVFEAGDRVLFSDSGQTLRKLGPFRHSQEIIASGTLSISGESLSLGTFTRKLTEISHFAIYGREHMVFSSEGINYEIKSDTCKSARKYLKVYELVRSKREAAV